MAWRLEFRLFRRSREWLKDLRVSTLVGERADTPAGRVRPQDVHDVLRRHLLVDGFELVFDTRASRGSWFVDARSGERYLDLYTFFASAALGANPPGLADDPEFLAVLAEVAANKPANSDVYTTHYAEFIQTFVRVLGDPALPHMFFVEGGALAVENALKTAFDWKSRRNEARGPVARSGRPGAASHARVPRSLRLHALIDQHRPEQDGPVPEVRLAAH